MIAIINSKFGITPDMGIGPFLSSSSDCSMSTQNLKDKEDFILPLKWKPGEDCKSKLLLSDPKIINLVVHSLVDASIPANSYIPAQTEWTDGSRSDVVYASPIKTTESLPPILIEVQYQVDQDFMLRLIAYASHTHKRYRVLPIILVIVTKSFSSADFQREFTISRNGPLLEASCKFWAKKCVLLTPNAVSNHLNQEILDPLIALGLFVTRHKLYQIPEHHRSDAVLMLLSSTAKEILSRETYQRIKKSSTFRQLNDAKRIFAQIIEENDNRVDSINKKTKSCAENGILAIEQIQKDLEEDNTREENSVATKKYTTEDALFIESLPLPLYTIFWVIIIFLK